MSENRINANTHVFLSAVGPDGVRRWLSRVENIRDKYGVLRLHGYWGEPSDGKPFTFEVAQQIRERFRETYSNEISISLSAGGDLIEERIDEPARTEDGRKPKPVWDADEKCFRLAEPGQTPRGPRWFVRLFDKAGNHVNSAWGDDPQQAVDVARTSQPLVMKRYQSAAPKQQETQAAPAPRPRLRPGDQY
jgi:hypothetical protein